MMDFDSFADFWDDRRLDEWARAIGHPNLWKDMDLDVRENLFLLFEVARDEIMDLRDEIADLTRREDLNSESRRGD